MIEIFVLIGLTVGLAKFAQSKGQSGWFAALGPVFWIIGEIAGVVFALLAGMDQLGAVGIGCMGGLTGAAIAFGIIAALPNAYSFDDDDEWVTSTSSPSSSDLVTPEEAAENPFVAPNS